MRYVLSLLAVVLGIWSLSWPLGWIAHITILGVCGSVFWVTDVLARPEVPCKYCDKGRDWDVTRTHFGRRCRGAVFGLGSCGGVGSKLRPAIKIFRLFGLATKIHDPAETTAHD